MINIQSPNLHSNQSDQHNTARVAILSGTIGVTLLISAILFYWYKSSKPGKKHIGLRKAMIKIEAGNHSDLMPALNIEGTLCKATSPLTNGSATCIPALRHNKEYKNSLLVLSKLDSPTIKSFSKDASNQEILDLINLVKRVKTEYSNHSSRQLIYCNGPSIASSPDQMHVQIRFNLDSGHNTSGRHITDTQWSANYVSWDKADYTLLTSANSYNIFQKGNDYMIQANTSSDSIATLKYLHNLIPSHSKYRVYWQFKQDRLMFVIKSVSASESHNRDFTKL